jgi:glutamyl-tRNA synthetase
MLQSQRLDLYRQRITELLEVGLTLHLMLSNTLVQSNKAYRCFCSTEELNAKRARLAASGSSSTYDRTCLSLTDEEIARRVRSSQKHVVRFNVSPSNLGCPFGSCSRKYKVAASSGEVEDMIFGVRASNRMSLPTDPILFKSDGYPTYHLASVVDDHEMRITHVVRGEASSQLIITS